MFLMSLVAFPVLAAGQLSYGADLALRTRYQWRGLTRHNGWVLQPDLLLSIGRPALRFTSGVWGNVELAAPDAATGIGPGRPWFGELNAWSELAGIVGPFDVAGGWTGYTFPSATGARGVPGGLHDTHEAYARVEMLSLPVIVPRVAAWYDLHAVKGGYLEGGLTIRVPAWTEVLVPIGSLFLGAVVGYSAGQEVNAAAPGEAAYFARRGFTHLDLSAALTAGYIPVGAWDTAVRLEYHVQIGWDPRTKFADAVTGDRAVRAWLGLSFSGLGPACRPDRAICPR